MNLVRLDCRSCTRYITPPHTRARRSHRRSSRSRREIPPGVGRQREGCGTSIGVARANVCSAKTSGAVNGSHEGADSGSDQQINQRDRPGEKNETSNRFVSGHRPAHAADRKKRRLKKESRDPIAKKLKRPWSEIPSRAARRVAERREKTKAFRGDQEAAVHRERHCKGQSRWQSCHLRSHGKTPLAPDDFPSHAVIHQGNLSCGAFSPLANEQHVRRRVLPLTFRFETVIFLAQRLSKSCASESNRRRVHPGPSSFCRSG